MSSILPPFIALKSVRYDRYLIYDSSNMSDWQLSLFGRIQFNGGNVFSPLAKFEVVTANTGIGLVHIRCFHNKKFLRQAASGSSYISPEADEPVEDPSSWMSTLFQPSLVDGDRNRIRLASLRSNQVNYTMSDPLNLHPTPNRRMLRIGSISPSTNIQEFYDVVDLESLIILPKHVAFKNDNSEYLVVSPGITPFMVFKSTDKGDPSSWFVVSNDGRGSAQIMSYHNKGFWRYNSADHSIWPDTPTLTATTSQSTSFLPIKVDRNVIALRSLGNNRLCGPFRATSAGNSLSAAYDTIVRESRLVMDELVLARRIYNADFNLANAVIYGETPVTMATANISNNTSAENTVEFKFAYTESRSTTWTSNNSWMVGVSVSVSFRIPFIGSTGIDASAEYSGSYEWGETLTSENALETTYSVVVPPHTSVTVSLVATKGSCDVPFSYYQRDELYDGTTEIYRKDDGLYTGINSYNFRYKVAETSTDSSRTDDQHIRYREQTIPMPSDAAIAQPLPSSENKTTQEQNLEAVPVPLPLEETPQEQLPLEETSQEQKVQLPLEEAVDEVVPVTVSPEL